MADNEHPDLFDIDAGLAEIRESLTSVHSRNPDHARDLLKALVSMALAMPGADSFSDEDREAHARRLEPWKVQL